MQRLDRTLAERWAALALANVTRHYPYKLDQLLQADVDALARGLILCLAPGLFGFFVLMRTGINLRFADPAMTMPQMVFAIAAMAAAYVINPPVRGMLLMIVALVLMFAAFTPVPPRPRAARSAARTRPARRAGHRCCPG